MTRKNQKSVQFYLSEAEKAALDKVRGSLSYREYTLRGIVKARPRGRPTTDATKDLEDQYRQRQEDNKREVHKLLLEANKKGLDAETSLRMLGDASDWFKIRCVNCGKTYYSQYKNTSRCPDCGQVNKTLIPLVVPKTVEPVILNQPITGEKEVPLLREVREGNLSEGYTPAKWPGQNRTGGTASNPKPSVIGEDHSRFKFGKKKKAEG